MTIVSIGGGHSLEAGAAASFAGRILKLRPGVLAKVNSAYRSDAEQAILRQRWEAYQAGGPWAPFALKPGMSKHNAGTAVDIDSSPWNPDHQWMVDNGRAHGWDRTNPAEPWHFEYSPSTDTQQEDDMATPVELWSFPVNRSGQKVQAIQELADTKTVGLQNKATLDALKVKIDALTKPAPVDLDALATKVAALILPAIAKAVNDDAAKRMQA